MKKVVLAALVMAVMLATSQAFAVEALLPGETLFNPNEGLAGPKFYDSTLPAYFLGGGGLGDTTAGGNLVVTMVSAYSGAFTGEVESTVYRDPGTGFLGFMYEFTNENDGDGLPDLVRATMGAALWQGVSITNAGSDESGSSTVGGGATSWTDGDPNFMLRDPSASGEGLTIQWRAGSDGTVLRGPDDFSALIFYETTATEYLEGDVGLIDSGQVGTARAFAPGSTIPEPAGLGLLGVALLGLRRKRR